MRTLMLLGILLLDLTCKCESNTYRLRGSGNNYVSMYGDGESHDCVINYLHNVMNRLSMKYFGSSVTIISSQRGGRNNEHPTALPVRWRTTREPAPGPIATPRPTPGPEDLLSGRGGGIYNVNGPQTRRPRRGRRRRPRK